jgi:hypothetical protein
VFADSDPRNVGDVARRAGSQREQAEIRGAAADIDDQDVPRLGIGCVACPQRLCQTVPFQPVIKDCLRLLEEPQAAGESGFLRRIQSEPLRGGVERGGNRDGDFLVIERAIRLGEAAVPGAPQVVQDQRGGSDGRDLLCRHKILRSPGQDRCGPVGRVVTQPGFC